jgi:hypothetical protein
MIFIKINNVQLLSLFYNIAYRSFITIIQYFIYKQNKTYLKIKLINKIDMTYIKIFLCILSIVDNVL